MIEALGFWVVWVICGILNYFMIKFINYLVHKMDWNDKKMVWTHTHFVIYLGISLVGGIIFAPIIGFAVLVWLIAYAITSSDRVCDNDENGSWWNKKSKL